MIVSTTPVLVPYIGLGLEKRRLGSVLGPQERAALAFEMLELVLRAIRLVPGSIPIVVSPDSRLSNRTMALGARFLRQRSIGLNRALEEARQLLMAEGYMRLAVVHADLPLLSAEDVEALLAAQPARGIAIGPDVSQQGTNALCCTPIGALPFCFGAGSFGRFCDAAARLGMPIAVIKRYGLSFDVDTAEALKLWRPKTLF